MREKEFLPLVTSKLGIENLNEMQKKMMAAASEGRDIMLLSPTGSGKTLAFTLPVLKMLKPPTGRVQGVVIAPSRELALQIAGVMGRLAVGYKVSVLYGGHKVEDEVNTLSVTPDIIVATPGRLLDHSKRRNVDLTPVRILVLDEFDKSLELGFEDDMRKIVNRLKNVSRIILTSATAAASLPAFLRLSDPLTLDFLGGNEDLRRRMKVYRVDSDSRDKLEGLLMLLRSLSASGEQERTIIFVNHRESAERTREFLSKSGVACVLYHGALEQKDRETALARFNNGSAPVLVATDLAARGLDIEGVRDIVHYHQPLTAEAYIHRNGRTARVAAGGDVYLLIGPDEEVKPFVSFDGVYRPQADAPEPPRARMATLHFSAGKKEKLSKGDIVGFLAKTAGVPGGEIGRIDVYDHYSLAAIPAEWAPEVERKVSGEKIKGEKRKISLMR